MALTWNAEKVKGWKDKGERVTDAVIYMTMLVGINEITDENAEEFFARVSLNEKLFGAALTKGGKERPLTLEDIRGHIGLRTNAATMTRTQFNKKQMDRWYRISITLN